MGKAQAEKKGPRTLFYDIDRGLKSLATDERIEQVFGFKPRRFIKSETMNNLFLATHVPGIISTEDDLGPIEEQIWTAKQGIVIEVLDSLTAFQAQKKSEVKGDDKRITLPGWGEIGEAVEDLAMKLTRTNTDVIITGHTKTQEDNDLGITKHIPALSGRMGNEIARLFDMVLYTIVETDSKTGTREYLWQVLADERRSAKCRIEEVSKAAEQRGGKLPQDFGLLFNLAKDYLGIKILILGDSGTGKTRSLRTLVAAADRKVRS